MGIIIVKYVIPCVEKYAMVCVCASCCYCCRSVLCPLACRRGRPCSVVLLMQLHWQHFETTIISPTHTRSWSR